MHYGGIILRPYSRYVCFFNLPICDAAISFERVVLREMIEMNSVVSKLLCQLS